MKWIFLAFLLAIGLKGVFSESLPTEREGYWGLISALVFVLLALAILVRDLALLYRGGEKKFRWSFRIASAVLYALAIVLVIYTAFYAPRRDPRELRESE